MGDTRTVMDRKGIFRLAEELGFGTLVLDELDAGAWERVHLPGSHWRRGFAVARPALDADGIVQTCCLKTHRFAGIQPVPEELGRTRRQPDSGRALPLYASSCISPPGTSDT